jgi:hypothetical protein
MVFLLLGKKISDHVPFGESCSSHPGSALWPGETPPPQRKAGPQLRQAARNAEAAMILEPIKKGLDRIAQGTASKSAGQSHRLYPGSVAGT